MKNFHQTNIPLEEQIILFEGKELSNNNLLNLSGIKENDLLFVINKKNILNKKSQEK